MAYYEYGGFRAYVSVAERRERAAKEVAKLERRGRTITPVSLEGRTIAHTFWGKAWCDNLERYSDYQNRLPRGRTYVRNGSVLDLQIAGGKVTALVSGSELYQVSIGIRALDRRRWRAIVKECRGGVGSLVELLQGRLSSAVMGTLVREGKGLFPAPPEIALECSCPDWASMCKHVAAALYGVGARLDEQPELFFTLRQVDQLELIDAAGAAAGLGGARVKGPKRLKSAASLSEMFGIDLAESVQARPARKAVQPRKGRTPRV